jgi:glycosyltransferase involved in cell wall biosynthesis
VTLLFITQKLHQQDAFVSLWVRAFIKKGYTVKVLCLENRSDITDIEIYSMGKEEGYGRVRQILRFLKFIWSLKYNSVFVHMAPVYGAIGSWLWITKRIPVYLWYTHYKRSFSMRIVEKFAKRIFCATPQSVPWITKDQKVVVGHGVDLEFWTKKENVTTNPYGLLVVHRLSRSKRLEINIRAVKLLPEDYTMVIYGIEAEKDYVSELKQLVKDLDLESRVKFMGTTPMDTLPGIYSSHKLILNMASETIDKTMLESMTCGCYPVTTRRNADAIGISEAPELDTPEAVSKFVQEFQGADADELYRVVAENHGLEGLIEKMDKYIKPI